MAPTLYSRFVSICSYRMDSAERVLGILAAWLAAFILALVSSPQARAGFLHDPLAAMIGSLMAFVIYGQLFFGGPFFWHRICTILPFVKSPSLSDELLIMSMAAYLGLLVILHILIAWKGWLWTYLILVAVLLSASFGSIMVPSGIA